MIELKNKTHLQVGKVVEVDLRRKDDDDAVAPHLHCNHLGPEVQLPDASVLVIVPHHYLCLWPARRTAAADERQEVAAKEHLDAAYSTAREVAAERLSERLAVVDPKPDLRAARKAAWKREWCGVCACVCVCGVSENERQRQGVANVDRRTTGVSEEHERLLFSHRGLRTPQYAPLSWLKPTKRNWFPRLTRMLIAYEATQRDKHRSRVDR